MIPIMVSAVSDGQYAGTRLPRYKDDEGGSQPSETVKQFVHRKKKRKKKANKEIAIPYANDVDDPVDKIRVTKTNWLGRLERDPVPKRSRIRSIKN